MTDLVHAVLLIVAMVVLVLIWAFTDLVRSPEARPGPFVRPSGPREYPEVSVWNDRTGEPVFRCGSIWRDGEEVGFSSCRSLASHFWITVDGEVHCVCRQHHDPGKWMVPNGHAATREESVALVVAQEVMLS